MTTTMTELSGTLMALAKLVSEAATAAEHHVKGREVVITVGKYAGRLGRIDGVVSSRENGLVYLVMVYRQDSREVLNSDGESRSYRPLDQFRDPTEEELAHGQ